MSYIKERLKAILDVENADMNLQEWTSSWIYLYPLRMNSVPAC